MLLRTVIGDTQALSHTRNVLSEYSVHSWPALNHYAAVAQGWDYEGWQELRAAGKAPAT